MKALYYVLLCVLILCSTQGQAQLFEPHYWDVQPNSKGRVRIMLTNFGTYGLDLRNNTSGTFWKGASGNRYIFGGGFWFAAQKKLNNGTWRKNCVLSYDANTATSEFTPSLYRSCVNAADSARVARNYVSTEFDTNGVAIKGSEPIGFESWPVRLVYASPIFGAYISDNADRNESTGKARFLSDEDIVSAYNDRNLKFYNEGENQAREHGYPLGLEVNQRSYFFDTGMLRDVVIMRFELTNTSNDTLRQCWFAPAMDYDIGPVKLAKIETDDRGRYYTEDPSLSMALCWSDTTVQGEVGKSLGYMGVTMLQSPAIDENSDIKQGAKREEELGVKSYRDWNLMNDPDFDVSRYDYLSAALIDAETPATDKRLLMGTGPFNLAPSESTIISIAIMFADPALGGEATGSSGDVANMVELCKATREYYNNLRTREITLDVVDQTNVDIYTLTPNPSAGLFTFHMPENIAEAELHVYSLLGEECYTTKATSSQVVDLSALASGNYFCRIRESNKWHTIAICLQH